MSTPEGGCPESERCFAADGRPWRARLAGETLAGSGHVAFARLALVQFFADAETTPRLEALLPAGRFPYLHDSELVAMLHAARPVPPPARP